MAKRLVYIAIAYRISRTAFYRKSQPKTLRYDTIVLKRYDSDMQNYRDATISLMVVELLFRVSFVPLWGVISGIRGTFVFKLDNYIQIQI